MNLISFQDVTITEKDFADLLIAYAGFPSKKKSKMLKRVKKEFKGESSSGIGLSDYLNFYQVYPQTILLHYGTLVCHLSFPGAVQH